MTPTPKERKMSSSSSSNSEAQNRNRFKNENAPPSYQQHVHTANVRTAYQSPLSIPPLSDRLKKPVSASNLALDSARSESQRELNGSNLNIFFPNNSHAMTTSNQPRSERNQLSQSMSDNCTPQRRSKIDRLTASRSMFEKDKFAESLAKVTRVKPF